MTKRKKVGLSSKSGVGGEGRPLYPEEAVLSLQGLGLAGRLMGGGTVVADGACTVEKGMYKVGDGTIDRDLMRFCSNTADLKGIS